MTDLTTTKTEIINKIIEIQAIPRPQYSAQQLHGNGMHRVQRQLDNLYRQKLLAQKDKLKKDLQAIEEYEQKILSLPLEGAPLTPIPNLSLWTPMPLPQRKYTRVQSKERLRRRYK